MVKLLLNAGADPNKPEKPHYAPNLPKLWGNTPLHNTAIYQQESKIIRIAEELLKAGADPYMTNNNGKSALDLAMSEGHTRILKLLKGYV